MESPVATKKINGIEYKIFRVGSNVPYSFIPGGTKQVFDNELQKYVLVFLEKENKDDLLQVCADQASIISSLTKENKALSDEIVKRDEEILRLNAHIGTISGAGKNLKKQG